jgi:sigma-B regulation protein RsbU (phosphoserine phosphatase)
MKLLIAEDDPATRSLLERILEPDYEVVLARDGQQAWAALCESDGPRLAVLDWQMPGLEGVAICQRARLLSPQAPMYLLLLTATRKATADALLGFDAGADDYLTKPFDSEELRARVGVGRRVLQLQVNLAERVAELEQALTRVHTLQGLLPICAWCKRIRDDRDYWVEVESYLSAHAEVTFTHAVCPQCAAQQHAEAEAAAAQARGSAGRPAYDHEELMSRLGHDDKLLNQLRTLLRQDVLVHLKELEVALAAADAQALARAAHSIQGVVALFAAHQASALAMQLEALGRGGQIARARPIAAELAQEIDALERQLAGFAQQKRHMKLVS